MTPYLSDKIKVMSFVCIILVVWIHTYYTEGDDYISSILLMNFWGGGVCMLANANILYYFRLSVFFKCQFSK